MQEVIDMVGLKSQSLPYLIYIILGKFHHVLEMLIPSVETTEVASNCH